MMNLIIYAKRCDDEELLRDEETAIKNNFETEMQLEVFLLI